MVSHISGFDGIKGSDFVSSTLQHRLPPLFVPSKALRQNLASLFWSGSTTSVKVGGSWLNWAGQGPFPALLLSHQDLVLSLALGKCVPHCPGLQQTWYEQLWPKNPPCSPGMVLCVNIPDQTLSSSLQFWH